MQVQIPDGTYIVAVSGGVDSVVLLDALTKQEGLKLVVTHFDHGIRPDSKKDRELVESLAQKYVLPFEYLEGKLGPKASEAAARKARYEFLESTMAKYKAKAIITAHHQDDLIETIIINILRGTGRKGLTSLKNESQLRRPLLAITKEQLVAYAKDNNLKWNEDSTNANTDYLRNWVRLTLIPKIGPTDRAKILAIHEDLKKRNPEIDGLLAAYIQSEIDKIAKKDIVTADHALAKEIIANWLRANGIVEFDQKTIERIVIGAKTLKSGKTVAVNKGMVVRIGKDMLLLKRG